MFGPATVVAIACMLVIVGHPIIGIAAFVAGFAGLFALAKVV
jgi:hypothetical protein